MREVRDEPFAAKPALYEMLWKLVRLTRAAFIAGLILIIPEIALACLRCRYVAKYIERYPKLSGEKWSIGYFLLILAGKALYNSWGITYANAFAKGLRHDGSTSDYERAFRSVYRMLVLWVVMAAAGFLYTLYSIRVYAGY